jgi:hypothetical protein
MTPTNSKNEIPNLLGTPPWDEELLRKCYFQNFTETREYIQMKHPGVPVYTSLKSIRLSLDVFLNAVSDLISSINRFKGESARPEFWHRPYRSFVEELEVAIQRGIASSAMCSMALVDHTREFSKIYTIPDYDIKLNHYFNASKEHRFIHSLRRYITHIKLTKANWMITHSYEDREEPQAFFFFRQTDLLKWTDWHSLAKVYIDEHPEGINVEELFKHYSSTVKEFHNWLRSSVMDSYGTHISDYLRYQNLMKRFEFQSYWNFLLKQAFIPKNVDPYMYLDRYLTKQELESVFSFPQRSKEQVDRIIELVDEYGACTEEIRNLVYRFFSIKKS